MSSYTRIKANEGLANKLKKNTNLDFFFTKNQGSINERRAPLHDRTDQLNTAAHICIVHTTNTTELTLPNDVSASLPCARRLQNRRTRPSDNLVVSRWNLCPEIPPQQQRDTAADSVDSHTTKASS